MNLFDLIRIAFFDAKRIVPEGKSMKTVIAPIARAGQRITSHRVPICAFLWERHPYRSIHWLFLEYYGTFPSSSKKFFRLVWAQFTPNFKSFVPKMAVLVQQE